MERYFIEKVSNNESIKTPEIVEQREFGAEILSKLLQSESLPSELARENEEVLFWLALTFEHPERAEKVFSLIEKYKDFVVDPEQIKVKLLNIMDQSRSMIDNAPHSHLNKKEYEARVLKIIRYFKPKNSFKKIIAVPADDIVGEQSGFSVSIDDEILIFSPSTNPDNFDHEFMHGFINPIVEKINSILTEQQKQKIIELASEKYKDPEAYGEDWFSLLAEEIIRVYNTYLKNGEDVFIAEDNKLRVVITSLYKEYEKEMANNKNVNFEDFLLQNIPKAIWSN